MNPSSEISITKICFQDIDRLVENFCFPWDSAEKTREKWERYFDERQKKIRTVAVVKCHKEIVGYGSLLYASEYPFFPNLPEISDLWIHEYHRGVGFGTPLEGVYKVNKVHLATSFPLEESLSDSAIDSSLPPLPNNPTREKPVTI